MAVFMASMALFTYWCYYKKIKTCNLKNLLLLYINFKTLWKIMIIRRLFKNYWIAP